MNRKVYVTTEKVQHPDTLAVGRDAVLFVDGNSFMRISCGDSEKDFEFARRYLLDTYTFYFRNGHYEPRKN
jgi:hypothetical protein